MTTEKKQATQRVLVVDAVRGWAVLCMMQWHCADAWLGGSIRDGSGFVFTRIVGGFAAPLFLLLAGVSAGLVFEQERLWAGVRRGIGIVVAGYAFKLFAWTVDYGAIVEPRNWAAIACDAITLGIAWRATQEKETPRRRWIFAALVPLAMLATWFALNDTTRTPSVIYRLDVLQAIGVALVLVNLVLAATHRWRAAPLVLFVLALLVALATPSFFGADLSWMPIRIADYLARTVVEPAPSGARFPMFPWLGYALLGAAIGRGVRARPLRDAWDVPFLSNGWIAIGLAILLGENAFEIAPFASWCLAHTEQVRNVLRLFFNASIAIGFAGLSSIVLPLWPSAQRVMLSLGRHSLIVYVVHLEIAFGYPGLPLHQRLGWAAWAFWLAALIASMIALSFWLDRREARRRAASIGTA
jgi:uncharacterized membrane protein